MPIRTIEPVFCVTFSLNDPFPVLFAGVMFVTVSHAALLVGVLQVVFDVTFIVVLPPHVLGNHLEMPIVSVAAPPACVTVICLVIPPPVTVTVPVRA